MNNKSKMELEMERIEIRQRREIIEKELMYIEDILYLCQKDNKKLLILDMDDTILNTGKALINILNYDNGIRLKYEDIRRWDMKDLSVKIERMVGKRYSKEDLLNIMSTDIWTRIDISKIRLKEEFIELYNSKIIKDNYYILFFTEGNEKSFEYKRELLFNTITEEDFCKRYFFLGITGGIHKTEIWKEINQISKSKGFIGKTKDYKDILETSILVEDKSDNLCSQGLNILIKNFKETDYNKVEINRDNLYIVNDLKEVKDIIEFFSTSGISVIM